MAEVCEYSNPFAENDHTILFLTFVFADSFATFAARLRTRSGMNALDTEWCETNAQSCSVIQRVLERSPQLVFVNGEFRHAYSTVPPSPPPPPLPPPRTFAYGPAPPTPSPPPVSPPPYYAVRQRPLTHFVEPLFRH